MNQAEMEREERLADLAADLVSIQQNELMLERLFEAQPGQWVDIDSLVGGLPPVAHQLDEMAELADGTIRVTWLDYPQSLNGPGYCLILFFLEELLWSHVAVYNKGRFQQKRRGGTAP